MPRARQVKVFFCGQCGGESPRWQGRCPHCGLWNALVEAPPARGGARDTWLPLSKEGPREITDVSLGDFPRLPLPYGEVNRVLGGGLVPGSVILMAGDPGIGKSTLLLQIAAEVAKEGKVLYISGEESVQQIKMRARRLGAERPGISLLHESDIGEIIHCLEAMKPVLAVLDSIQAVESPEVASGLGTVAQVRECASVLLRWAKANRAPVLVAGHVTKEGDVAGPRVLEHMVDTVLYLEGEPFSGLRLLRAIKNRFGSTNEVAFFHMGERGLTEVEDASKLFLSQRREGVPGSAVVPLLEGTRPLLVEVQALLIPSQFPSPRRTVTGLDPNRVAMICAVLWRHGAVPLGSHDVVVNVAGGLRISEAAADLAVALAIASSLRNVPVVSGTAVIGELGLTGEVRPVPRLEERLRELARLGLKRAMVPKGVGGQDKSLEVLPVSTLREALERGLDKPLRRQGMPLEERLEQDEEAAQVLARGLAHEQANAGKDYYLGWEWYDVQARPAKLREMMAQGLIRVNFKSNSSVNYRVAQPQEMTRALEQGGTGYSFEEVQGDY